MLALVKRGRHFAGVLFALGGTGPVYLSDRVIGQLDLGSRLQFPSHIGAGAFFSPGTRWWLGYRYSHTSNAEFRSPNPGINFHLLELGHAFGGPRP